MIIPLIVIICVIACFFWIDEYGDYVGNVFFGVVIGVAASVFLWIAVLAVIDIGNFSEETTVYQIESIEFVGDNAVVSSPDDKTVFVEYVVLLDDCDVNTVTQRVESPDLMPWFPSPGSLDSDTYICLSMDDYVENPEPR